MTGTPPSIRQARFLFCFFVGRDKRTPARSSCPSRAQQLTGVVARRGYSWLTMIVSFKRTGARRYAVVISFEDGAERVMDPAPGYDDDIPHDLVHYVVEAELGFTRGVFGRAAQGGGTFVAREAEGLSARERARQRRKQQKREGSLRARDESSNQEMATSEQMAGLCDVAWRRKHGQRPDPLRKPPEISPAYEPKDIARVLERLDALAPQWRALPVGAALSFEWPSVDASTVSPKG